uniref:Retrotransposon gag protein n=1 Tax=Vitis vinifera TaxID=29760 RepID=A5BBZ5_VITVI|nr:hypothetical protein VITISV_013671 [Vitis vinifera]
MAKVKRLQRVGGGARGVLLQTHVLWTSLGETGGPFRNVMEISQLDGDFAGGLKVINFVDYSRLRIEIRVHQLIEHQSTGHTPARHESNGVDAGNSANFTVISPFQSTCDLHHKFDIDMKAKVAAMTRRFEELELKKICEVQVVSETPMQIMPCSICQSYEHLVEECPTIPTVREMFGDQIDNLQYSISRLTNLNTVQEKERFPSQPHQNPKGIHEVEAHEGEPSQVRNVKALITLRSGKEVELPTPKLHDEKEGEEETEKREKIKGNKKGSSGRKEDMIQQ